MNIKDFLKLALLVLVLALALGAFVSLIRPESDPPIYDPSVDAGDGATEIDSDTVYVPNPDANGVDLNKWEKVDTYGFFDNTLGFSYDNRTFRFVFTSEDPGEENMNTNQVSTFGLATDQDGVLVEVYNESEGYGTFDRTFTFEPKLYGNMTWDEAFASGYNFTYFAGVPHFSVYVLK